MFALRTTKAINITTLEVDIRLDKAEDDLDLEGTYELGFDNHCWTNLSEGVVMSDKYFSLLCYLSFKYTPYQETIMV